MRFGGGPGMLPGMRASRSTASDSGVTARPAGRTSANVLRVVLALAAVLFGLHVAYLASLQGAHCIDDAYISFRYAQNLARGHGLVFNSGERIEGYTNFGWLLLLAPLEGCGADTASVARWLNGALGLALVGVALCFLWRQARSPPHAVLVAAGLLVADGSLARWAQDGLEVPLFALLVLLGAQQSLRSGRAGFALILGAATWVRPEGALCFVVLLAAKAWRARAATLCRRDVLNPLAGYAAFVLPWAAWKLVYYGTLIPNTFHAKVGCTGAQVARGLRYVSAFLLEQRGPLLVATTTAVIVLALRRRASPRPAWVGAFAWLGFVYLGYVALVGGDWMGPGRFAVPVVALLYLAAAELLGAAVQRWPLSATAALAAGLGSMLYLLTSVTAEQASLRTERRYLESRAQLGLWLRQTAAPGDTLLSNEIGQLAYLSGLYTHDLHGLTDPHIAHLKVKTLGQGKAGHEKTDLVYSFSKQPTWVVIPGIYVNYLQLRAQFPFFAEYEPVMAPASIPLDLYRGVLRRRPIERSSTR